jgi:demethylmenaquinone methyltransferase/2-methoxy-6-polyprenyl-1,4-benzoquinol methylase
MGIAAVYDIINTVIFLPSGGSPRLRRSLVEALEVRPGHRVLELGCGTGQVTAALLAAGADVVAVDELTPMLVKALERAPGAVFVRGDAIEAPVEGGYDRVVLSFVLHGFDAADRTRLLGRAATALSAGGRIGVLEWSLPRGRLRRAVWRRFLMALEPAPGATRQLLEGALDAEIPAAGLRVDDRRAAAGGRAQILLVSQNERREVASQSKAA